MEKLNWPQLREWGTHQFFVATFDDLLYIDRHHYESVPENCNFDQARLISALPLKNPAAVK